MPVQSSTSLGPQCLPLPWSTCHRTQGPRLRGGLCEAHPQQRPPRETKGTHYRRALTSYKLELVKLSWEREQWKR